MNTINAALRETLPANEHAGPARGPAPKPSSLREPPSSGGPADAPAPKSSSLRNVMLLVGVAIVIFMAFSAYSVRKEIQGGAKLTAIKDLYFPVLQRLDANVVRVDKVEALFIEVVVTGDHDLIDKTAEVGLQADSAYAQIATLDPARRAEVQKLRTDLQQYLKLATKACLAFLQTGGADMAPMKSMNVALADTKSHLTTFRQTVYSSFLDTLDSSQKDSRVRLLMGTALGLMNLGFMAVLVYFIRNNVKMMSVIAEQNASLEHRVAERTAQLSQKTSDINAMLQNMNLGVCTVVPGNRIHPEFSSYLKTIFSTDDLADKDLLEALFARSALGVDGKDQIAVALGSILGEDSMMFTLNGHLLASEMHIQNATGEHRIVHMDWSPIVNDLTGTTDKVLLITEDVTHLRELEESAKHQKDELEIISRIIRISVGKFNDFVDSANGYVAANRELLNKATGRDDEVIAALFRNMHTIKGNARTFEFKHITDAAHHAEQNYDRLRKDAAVEWNGAQLLVELDAVAAAIAQYVDVNEHKLGRKGRAADLLTTRGVFVGNDQLADLRRMAQELTNPMTAEEAAHLQQAIAQLGLITLARIVSGSVDSISSLAVELQKPAPAVDIVSGEIAFNSTFAEALKSCFMHIVRNSMDHGIESPAERLAAHKSAQGRLRFVCEEDADHVELHVSDDGRGLALHKLYEKGLESGVFAAGEKPSREAVADVIFRSGLSTSAHVTQVSGRGVGMDAVRTFLKEQGASIRVALSGSGTDLGFVPFEFIVDIPRSAYTHS